MATPRHTQTNAPNDEPVDAGDQLKALVRLLARQAAREAWDVPSSHPTPAYLTAHLEKD